MRYRSMGNRWTGGRVGLLYVAAGAFLAGIVGGSAQAASTQVWEMTTWQDYLAGKFRGVAVSREGVLTLAPAIQTLHEDGQSAVWSAVRAPNGTLYLGTGHRGRIIEVTAAGQASVFWNAPEPEIFALALDLQGTLYAATSPDGKIYRVERGRATEVAAPGRRYLWSLIVGPDGALYAGAGGDSGDQGHVLAVRNPRTAPSAEVWYESGQAHITALAFDAQGQLLAGSDPNGLVYRITGKDKAFIVYDGSLPEIRSIVTGLDGRLYIASLGGSVSRRAASATAAIATTTTTVTAPPASITVEAQGGFEIKAPAAASRVQAAAPAVTAPLIEIAGVEKSNIVRIDPDGSVETMWTSKDENAFDLALSGDRLVFPTDGSGRIYELDGARKLRLLSQTNDGELVRLIPSAAGLVAASANQGRVLQLGPSIAATGEYESPVHDAGAIARWGRLDWRSGPGEIRFRTRTGNSARPDRTWSDWSPPLASPGAVVSPHARYVQWTAEFRAPGATVDSVSLAYRPQNNAPVVKMVTVVSQLAAAVAAAGAAKTPATPAGAAYSITVTDTGDSGPSSLSGTATQNAGRPGVRQIVVSWTADDYDGDSLSYSLHFRGEGERAWKPLKTNLTESSFTIDGDALADGRYWFRVTASDAPANPPTDAREAELISAPVRVDQTPPVVSLTREGSAVLVRATDTGSPLRRCEMSLDARAWVLVEAEDGVTDSFTETFRIDLAQLTPGEHLVTVRVTDAAGNPGLAKIVVE